ncbi:MAG: FKBP-type peptidyl-prolyl cis-trans isomerase [Prevotellaceae bacterium]|jgi:FKBP-type peptidyl-prolyl cis-trans isomerase SlyD|nr:FKBP-type peptidyl-prolyl cis-trans isomerase [Prevotellaceae bacterium]
MKIEKNKVVSLSYVLSVDNDVVETVTAEKPMNFITGTGYLLPKFEDNLLDKKTGDAFEFVLNASDAYGEVLPEAIVELPKNLFEVDGVIEPDLLVAGNVLPMSDSDGNRLNGSIDEVRDTTVIMNFNHPLAGEALHFKGTVLTVRDATPDELLYGLYGERAQSCGGSCNAPDCSECH